MMKISEDIKDISRVPIYVNQHLSFLETENIKSIVAVFTFLLLDLGTLPLLYPKVTIIYYLAIPLLIFIHIWAIRILFKNPFSTQFESLLFIGVLGLIGTACYFILIQKMAYINLGIRTPVYYIISTLVYLLVIGILVYYQIHKYSNVKKKTKETAKAEQKDKSSKYTVIIAIFPALGYFLAQKVMKQSDLAMHILMYFVYSIFAVTFAYFAAKYLHKYVFMKVNMRFVRYQKPEKKVIKQAEAKGKSFIIK